MLCSAPDLSAIQHCSCHGQFRVRTSLTPTGVGIAQSHHLRSALAREVTWFGTLAGPDEHTRAPLSFVLPLVIEDDLSLRARG